MTRALKTAFLELAAERYFKTTTEAIRKFDANHLILGCRFAGMEGAHDIVWKVAGRYCDVMSFNVYPWRFARRTPRWAEWPSSETRTTGRMPTAGSFRPTASNSIPAKCSPRRLRSVLQYH